jgi:long-chain acyl-CoA synthetase
VEKVWLKSYPKDVPAEINPDAYQSIPEILEDSCKQFSNLPAFYSMGTTLTFQQVDQYARAFAAYLQQVLGLKKGDRVALMLPNVLQYPIAMLGILKAGLVVVNVNPLYTPTELAHQMKDSGAETIVVLANFARTVERALPSTSLKHVIVTTIGDLFPWPKSVLTDFVVKYVKKAVPAWNIPHALQFKRILATGKNLNFQRVPLTNQDIAFLQYTGGTTGVSKGAILTHRNLIANLEQAQAWLKSLFRPGKEIAITALPLYHIFSLTANCLVVMRVGGFNVLVVNARDINSIIDVMSKFKFTVLSGVNTLFNALLKHPKFAQLDFKSLRLTLGGGMAVMRAVAEKWQAVTGTPLLEAYGLTETSPCVTINPIDLKAYNGTVGLPVPSTSVCILDDDGNEVTLGQTGELGVKGPQVMRGYWQNPVETQKVFTRDGWLLTGDIASIDENGFVRLLERKKDMILVSGFNVYPNEVEDVLISMPGVREVAVVGVPDDNSGEVPKAFIVKDDQKLTAEQVHAFCYTKLTPYKVPKFIQFCDELPKTNVGKVLRRALRQVHAT